MKQRVENIKSFSFIMHQPMLVNLSNSNLNYNLRVNTG